MTARSRGERVARLLVGAGPKHPDVVRQIEGQDVVLRIDGGGRQAFIANVKFMLRLYGVVFLGAWLVALILSPAMGGPRGNSFGMIAYFVLIVVAPMCAWFAFWSTARVEFRIGPDRLRYTFSSRLGGYARQWHRADVSAVRWNGRQTIRVFDQRNEVIGRMFLPHPMGERWCAAVAFDVRTTFGF